MTRKNHHALRVLCAGLLASIATPAFAGWGSSYGSGGSFGSSYGSSGGFSYSSFGGSTGSHASSGGSFGSHGSLFGRVLHHRAYSSSGSHGSTGTALAGISSGGSSGGSWGGGSSGLFHGGVINKLRAHHHQKMAWLRSRFHASSGGSWGSSGGSHGSSGGSWGGSHYGSHGSSRGGVSSVVESHESGYAPEEPTEAEAGAEGDAAAGAGEDGGSESNTEEAPPPTPVNTTKMDRGSIFVKLPAEAKLFVNGHATTSTGTERKFVSNGLKKGFKYQYSIKAVLELNGEELVMTKDVDLRAGEANRVAFEFDSQVETKLTIHVPEDALIEIAGAKTTGSGSVRHFSTSQLKSGQVWQDYKIVATLDRDGTKFTKTQSIDLTAGEDRAITFEFDEKQLAAR